MVSEARRLAAQQTFGSWGMDAEQVELACLLVSEVVTNAVLHASITPSPGRELDFGLDPVIRSAPVGPPRTPEPVPAAPFPLPHRMALGEGRRGGGPRPGSRRTGPGRLGPGLGRPGPGLGRPGAGGWPDRAPGVRAAPAAERRPSRVRGVRSQGLRLPLIRDGGGNRRRRAHLYLVEQLATRWGSRPHDPGRQGGLGRDAAQRLPGLDARAAAAVAAAASVAPVSQWPRVSVAVAGSSSRAYDDHDDDRRDPVLARDAAACHLAAQPPGMW